MNDFSHIKKFILTAVCLTQAQLAVAQLEEVIVTAQKRSQSAQDVPVSVSAFNEEDFQEFGSDIGSLTGQIPNVEAYGNGSYFQSFFIRGIGLNEFAGNYNAPVAIHFDEVYVSKNWMAARPTFDISRIEVLKGPQGTLFGRNTTGGTVNFYTQAPTESFEGYVRVRADNFERYSVEGALNGPLSENTQGRLSYYGGFGNGGPQFNEFTNAEHGAPDIHMLRGQLQWSNDTTTVRVLGHFGRDKSETPAYKSPGIYTTDGTFTFCPEVLSGQFTNNQSACARWGGIDLSGFDPLTQEAQFEEPGTFTINQNFIPSNDNEFFGGYVRIEHDFGWSELTSITAYEDFLKQLQEDSDSTPINSSQVSTYSDIQVFTQELRLTGQFNNKSNYVFGLFYEHDEMFNTDSAELGTEAPIGPPIPRLYDEYVQKIDSVAVFAHTEWALSDELTLTLGARYTDEKTTLDAFTAVGLNDPVPPENRITILAVVDSLDDSRTDTDFSWRTGLAWDLTDDVMIYGNLTTSFRTGGYTVPFGGGIIEYEPEDIFAQEIGIKSRFLDNTLQLNAAVFRYEYDNLQINVDDPASPLVPITRNIGKSETTGFEAELVWQPNQNWEVRGGLGYLDAEFTKTDRVMTTISNLGPIPLQGNTPVNSPEWQLNGLLRYSQQVSDNWTLMLMSDFRWVDDRFLEATNQPADTAGSYSVVNARATLYSANNKWAVSLWGKNIFDEEYLTYINNLPGPGFKIDVYGEAASYGLEFSYIFN